MKDTHYLDTSAVNYLYRHPQRDELAERITEHSTVFVSVFTIVELASTSDKSYRNGILRFAKSLTVNIKPLAMPRDLLKRARVAIRERHPEMDNAISGEWDGVWGAYNDPQALNASDLKEIVEFKKQQDKWFEEMHSAGRTGVQSELKRVGQSGSQALRRYASFVRPIARNQAQVADHIMRLTPSNDPIDGQEATELCQCSEHWRFLLAGLAYSIYCRGFKHDGHGKAGSPGSIDVQQAVYLAACDWFVTADKEQYRMIREIIPFGHKKRRAFLCPN